MKGGSGQERAKTRVALKWQFLIIFLLSVVHFVPLRVTILGWIAEACSAPTDLSTHDSGAVLNGNEMRERGEHSHQVNKYTGSRIELRLFFV